MSATIDWYLIANKNDFIATGLPSQELTLFLGTLGDRTIILTQGNTTSITVDNVMLSLNMNDKNPFVFEDFSVWEDDDHNIWLGLLNEN